MERYSDKAIEIINELHTERIDYESEYIPLIDCANQCAAYEDTGLAPEDITRAFDEAALQEREERSKGCEFCGAKLYFKTTQYARPLLAPLTEVQALRDKLLDLTGEVYVEIDAGFCPMCGQRREDTK